MKQTTCCHRSGMNRRRSELREEGCATAESARRGRDLKWESWTRYEMGDGRDAIWFMEEDNTLLRWRAQRR